MDNGSGSDCTSNQTLPDSKLSTYTSSLGTCKREHICQTLEKRSRKVEQHQYRGPHVTSSVLSITSSGDEMGEKTHPVQLYLKFLNQDHLQILSSNPNDIMIINIIPYNVPNVISSPSKFNLMVTKLSDS